MKFHAQLSILLALGLFAVVLFGAGGVTQSTYTTPAGTTYALSLGRAGACGPVEGGFACTFDHETRVSVQDQQGCGLVVDGASCTLIDDGEPVYPDGASSLECPDGSVYLLSAGPNGSCDANNAQAMTCSSTYEKDYARATCSEGCRQVDGTGQCTAS